MSPLLCAIPRCPCLKAGETLILCPRHFAMVPQADRCTMAFYANLTFPGCYTDNVYNKVFRGEKGYLATYWRLWRATIAQITKADKAFLAKFKFSKDKTLGHPAPLTGVSNRGVYPSNSS